ncbi:methionine-R-sulfoxide reductase B1 isoform X2 [Octodon degus]|uniref:Methionine-R-sulfoxide reductase B1 n=1 Tax=Octodon degus TaxID=10160 RepID=A0A6P6E4X0_OCTDE|nr:methionine-R-sulfoxide reductase B1 isoform X2 [Octodon degus]
MPLHLPRAFRLGNQERRLALGKRSLTCAGIYVCAKCGYELFSSRSKYAHSSPWPAFTDTIHADSVAKCPEHNRPGALKTKKLLPPRGTRWAAHPHPQQIHNDYILAFTA